MTLRKAKEFLEVVDKGLRLIADACTPWSSTYERSFATSAASTPTPEAIRGEETYLCPSVWRSFTKERYQGSRRSVGSGIIPLRFFSSLDLAIYSRLSK